jgi:uncharacterized protein (TIGR02147 family)
MEEPNILKYSDYRNFLSDYFKYKKFKNKYFSHRSFNMRAGFGSPSFLKMVIDRKRNLTHKSMAKVAIGFNLSEIVTELFCLLVVENQAVDIEKQKKFLHELKLAQEKYMEKITHMHSNDIGQIQFFLKWEYIALYEYIGTDGFNPDLEDIKVKFDYRFSVKEIQDVLGLLIESRLIETDPVKGYIKARKNVSLTGRFINEDFLEFYTQMINQSLYALNNNELDNCYFSSSTMHIDLKHLPIIKDKISELRQEIVRAVDAEFDGDEVYQINMQYFNLLSGNAG